MRNEFQNTTPYLKTQNRIDYIKSKLQYQRHKQQKKIYMNKLDSNKIKTCVLQKTSSRKWKDEPTEWEKALANCVFDEELVLGKKNFYNLIIKGK